MYRRGYRPLNVQRQQNAERYDNVVSSTADKYRKNVDPSYVDQDGRNSVHLAVLVALRDATSDAASGDQLQATSSDSPASLALDQAVKAGCDLNAVDRWGRRPIHYAAEAGHVFLLRRLLRHGVDPNALTGTVISTINGSSSSDIGVKPSSSPLSAGLSPLMVAVQNGRVEATRVLLKNGAKASLTNERSETAVHHAAASSSCADECVLSLVGQQSGSPGCTNLINHQDCEGSTALMFAARNKRPSAASSAISVLIKLGANVNLVDSQGRTAVHWAAQSNLPDVVSLLHAAGADLDTVDSQGDTAYVTAIKANSPDALQSLITAGCDTCTIDGFMATAVALAAVKGHAKVIETLVKNGDEPDDFGYFGKTPLMLAAYEAHFDAVDTLLRVGADPNLGARTGGTALAAALLRTSSSDEADRHRIVVELIRAGVDVNQRTIVAPPSNSSVGTGPNYFRSICSSQMGHWPLSYAVDTGYVSLVRIMLLAGSEIPSDEIRRRQQQTGSRFFDVDELLGPIVEWTSQPRSLQHAARAVVRRAVMDGRYRADRSPAEFRMQDAIKSLPVADRLRRYLNMEELDSISVHRARVLEGAGAGMMQSAASPCGARAIETAAAILAVPGRN